MECPQCRDVLLVPAIAIMQLQRTGQPLTLRTRCCGYGVRLTPHGPLAYSAQAYTGPDTCDGFGQPIRQR